MNKFKKSMFAVATLAGVLSPLALAVACTDETKKPIDEKKPISNYSLYANNSPQSLAKRYDSPDIQNVRIGVTFSQDGAQWNALQGIIDRYNAIATNWKNQVDAWNKKSENDLTEDEKTKKEEYEKFLSYYRTVEIKSLGSGGYNAGAESIRNMVSNKNRQELVSVILNYPVVASNLAESGMLLNFDSEDEYLRNTLTDFNHNFTVANQRTSYISNQGTWVIPGLVSSNVQGVNSPVLSYILETMESLGAKIELSQWDAIKAAGQGDRESVKQLWGEKVENAESLSGYTIKDSTFTTFKPLIDFAQKAKKLFKNAVDAKSQLHILGIDDIAGFLQTVIFSAVGADTSEMLVRTKTEGGNILADYSPIRNTESLVGTKMQEFYQILGDAIKTGAVVLKGDGEYTSNDQRNHKFALGIGSTAGYTNNFVQDNRSTTEYVIEDEGKQYAAVKRERFFLKEEQGKKYLKITTNYSRYPQNGIYKTDEISPTLVNDPHQDRYSYFVHGETEKAKFDELYKFAESSNITSQNNKYGLYLFSTTDAASLEAAEKLAKEDTNFVKLGTVTSSRKQNEGAEFVAYYTKDTVSKIKSVTRKGTQVLNQNELFVFDTANKWEKDSDPKVSYLQGPSFMGVHVNDEVDNATRLFVKFLLSNKVYEFDIKARNSTQEDPKFDKKTGKPMDILSSTGSYVFPSSDFTTKNTEDFNAYLKVTHDNFKKVVEADTTGNNWVSYSEIGDPKANEFRNALKSTFISYAKAIVNSGNLSGSYKTEIVDKILAQAKDIFQ
ncbi:P80 family lipoprotein [Mycoplasma sp. 744]|uniref:P68 family surface lipoprotein n=1 Tax=Mycoplasma sp. 744 TaxID=3108531 RepID=UPI002B1E283A|nr:P80 family lipoprotein [Mycoplasma sp. 744]MEA4115361.1 P80 family lipoprotein [Mycoplasma sp. 744]